VDAQLPQLLAVWLKEYGYDTIHTLELPEVNRSNDQEIIAIADKEGRIVISKDSDFQDDHVLNGKPKKLLVIRAGNIRNRDLIRLFEQNIDRIENLFRRYVLIEVNQSDLKFIDDMIVFK